jgi:hypothetical protein
VLWIPILVPHSWNFFFFIIYKLDQGVRLFVTGIWQAFTAYIVMKHSNLFARYVSYEENEVFWIPIMVLHSKHFFFFVTYLLDEWVRVFVVVMPLQPSIVKHSSLFGRFVCCKENDVLWIPNLALHSQHFFSSQFTNLIKELEYL